MKTESEKKVVSVIIPVLNEEQHLSLVLDSIGSGDFVEVIVVDGGSTDRTPQIAEKYGVKILFCRSGRARQLNAGAAEAKGEIYLFLHGDTTLPEGFAELVRKSLAEENIAAGAFQLSFDSPLKKMKFISWGANVRSKIFQMPYGDQALFMKASRFNEIGGFPEISIMEDFSLVRELKKRGKILILDHWVVSSARRWERHGTLRVSALNQLIVLGFFLGFHPDFLAKLYRLGKKG
ncbi:MAG: TIGR04283 family arsenosugar biosynthesis glycosyltransferase [Desulfobulbaceae bacterium]|nr:TIGR04283 family arsenosugar biosynthesis glycosyltransferase [Desulfobulbaceae bacterium]